MKKTISLATLKRVVKESGFRWKRMRRCLRGKRDPELFRDCGQILKIYQSLEDKGEIDLFYGDESCFSLVPNVPYGWQKETIRIPSAKSQNVKILGFLSRKGELVSYEIEGKMDSEIMISCIDDFAKTLKKKTILVLDNASIHTSGKMQKEMARWKKEYQLEIDFLPPYSPELNLIEILWRKMKYDFIPLNAYETFSKLRESVKSILLEYTQKYRITFA